MSTGYRKKDSMTVDRKSFSAQEIVDAIQASGMMDAFRSIENKLNTPFVNLPKNTSSIDIRRVSEAASGTVEEVFLTYQPPQGYEAIITGYGIYSDAQFAAQTEFIPTLNGSRVFQYHGTPTDLNNPRKLPYRISLGLGPDLTDVSLIECALRIGPEDTFVWKLTNTSTVAQVMGVRFKGYIRSVNETQNFRIGG